MKPARNKQSGQSLVEMAISLMIILLLLLGAVEISLTLFQYVTIRDAAQEGGIYASIEPEDEGGIKYRAKSAASDVVQLVVDDPDPAKNNVTVTINGKNVATAITDEEACEGTISGVPNSITVKITYAHKIIFPLINNGNAINLTAFVTNTILKPMCPVAP